MPLRTPADIERVDCKPVIYCERENTVKIALIANNAIPTMENVYSG